MKKYKLRNGIIVAVGTKDKKWSYGDVKVIFIPKGLKTTWKVGKHECLLTDNQNNPLKFRGGSYGKKYDIVSIYKKPRSRRSE